MKCILGLENQLTHTVTFAVASIVTTVLMTCLFPSKLSNNSGSSVNSVDLSTGEVLRYIRSGPLYCVDIDSHLKLHVCCYIHSGISCTQCTVSVYITLLSCLLCCRLPALLWPLSSTTSSWLLSAGCCVKESCCTTSWSKCLEQIRENGSTSTLDWVGVSGVHWTHTGNRTFKSH